MYSVFLPFKSYTPGDILNLQLKLNNLTNINNYIISIKILLKKQLLITHFFDYMKDNEIILNYNQNIIHNKNNDTIIKIVNLQIPFNCKYSILPDFTNNLFEVKYILSTNITICKDNTKILQKNIDFPIIIGSYRAKYNNIEKDNILPKYDF